MKTKSKILCTFLAIIFVSCAIISTLLPLSTPTYLIEKQTVAQSIAQTVAITEEPEVVEPTEFDIPTIRQDSLKKDIPLFTLSEYTSTNTLYNYPTTSLPIEILFNKAIRLDFQDLTGDASYFYENDEITKITLTWSYMFENEETPIATREVFNKENQTKNINTTFVPTSPHVEEGLIMRAKVFVDKTTIINNVETVVTYETMFRLKYYNARTINAHNTLMDKNGTEHPLFIWSMNIRNSGGDSTPVNIPEPIFNQIFSSVSLEYSTILYNNGEPEAEDEDIGLKSIKINGTTYNVSAFQDIEDDSNPNNGKKIINFTASGDYTIEILSNEYQEGLNKEYTCKKYSFTIDNQPNLIGYIDKNDSAILNFESTIFQYVSGSVTLRFWGISSGETIVIGYKPFNGGLITSTVTLTNEHLADGYQLKDSGEYTITPSNDTIKSLKFAISNNILNATEKEKIEEKLDIFHNTNESITNTFTNRTIIAETEFVNTYSVTGLSLYFNNNNNVSTISSYTYNFDVNYALAPNIIINPVIANGKSTTSNVTINEPVAAGKWELEVKYGGTTKTYYKNNFDKINISENGRYTITLKDEAGQETILIFSKSFKMNAATVILLVIGIMGISILTIVIIRSRYTLQVK